MVVICADSHADKPFTWRFTRQASAAQRGRVWAETDRGEVPIFPPRKGNPRPKAVILLDATNQRLKGHPTTGRGRRYFQLKCPRCNINLSVTAERIEPAFDRIAESCRFEVCPGVSEISLSVLAAMLGS
jgi:phage FluMu protein Com